MYFVLIILVCYLMHLIEDRNIYDFITAFFVIDISNSERKNLDRKGKIYFYNSISMISRSVICGFIAPLFYIMIFGNLAGIIYTLIYNISFDDDLNILKWLFVILSIIPSIISQAFLYLIYAVRNRRFGIDFKGDYLINCFSRPILNADILAAYVESVNFYYYFNNSYTEYLKSYGDYKNKINDICIKDYLSIAYSICMITFILFYIVNLL